MRNPSKPNGNRTVLEGVPWVGPRNLSFQRGHRIDMGTHLKLPLSVLTFGRETRKPTESEQFWKEFPGNRNRNRKTSLCGGESPWNPLLGIQRYHWNASSSPSGRLGASVCYHARFHGGSFPQKLIWAAETLCCAMPQRVPW